MAFTPVPGSVARGEAKPRNKQVEKSKKWRNRELNPGPRAIQRFLDINGAKQALYLLLTSAKAIAGREAESPLLTN